MEILKRLVKVQVKSGRKLLDKEQSDYRKCTRALDPWDQIRLLVFNHTGQA
jgi:hypothetical protein